MTVTPKGRWVINRCREIDPEAFDGDFMEMRVRCGAAFERACREADIEYASHDEWVRAQRPDAG